MSTHTHAASAPSLGRTMLNKVPEVTLFFWIIKIMCTTVGETAADYLNVDLGFGLTNTTYFTGALLAVLLLAQFRLRRYLARGMRPADAGRQAFSRRGLGCASCHGDQAQGQRGPNLAGGAKLGEFRHVHGDGLFPPAVVSDRDFAAVDAWLRTLQRRQERRG